jgi:hypothetical protein
MLPEHHLVPDPNLLLGLNQNQPQTSNLAGCFGNFLRFRNGLGQTARGGLRLFEAGRGQGEVAFPFKVSQRLQAGRDLPLAPMVQEPIPVANLARQGGAVRRGLLIQKQPNPLKVLGKPERILDQVLGADLQIHIPRLRNAPGCVQRKVMGNRQS